MPSLAPKSNAAHARDHLGGEIRRAHVRAAQLAQRDAAVGLDAQAQDHLTAQGRIAAQLAVVEPVQLRLVAVEHDLDLLVRCGPPIAPRADALAAVAAAAAAARDRARRARDLDAAAIAPAPPPLPPAFTPRESEARLMPPLEPGAGVLIIERCTAPLAAPALVTRASAPSRASC